MFSTSFDSVQKPELGVTDKHVNEVFRFDKARARWDLLAELEDRNWFGKHIENGDDFSDFLDLNVVHDWFLFGVAD